MAPFRTPWGLRRRFVTLNHQLQRTDSTEGVAALGLGGVHALALCAEMCGFNKAKPDSLGPGGYFSS